MNKDYVKHDDPGHGWLEVPVSDLIELGIQNQITTYSYISHDRRTALLEEDCDMSTFIYAAEKAGWNVHYTIEYTEYASWRDYTGFTDYSVALS